MSKTLFQISFGIIVLVISIFLLWNYFFTYHEPKLQKPLITVKATVLQIEEGNEKDIGKYLYKIKKSLNGKIDTYSLVEPHLQYIMNCLSKSLFNKKEIILIYYDGSDKKILSCLE